VSVGADVRFCEFGLRFSEYRFGYGVTLVFGRFEDVGLVKPRPRTDERLFF
jgi:hypothetical protein